MSDDPSKRNQTEWQDALCTFDDFPWPFKVQLSSKSPPSDGQTDKKTIKLYPADLKHIVDEKKPKVKNASNEFEVPAKWLIPGIAEIHTKNAETPNKKKGHDECFDEYYNQVIGDNLSKRNVVAWAPPPYSVHSRSELYSCILYYAGVQIVQPYSAYAFVCPRQKISDGYRSSMNIIAKKIPGWGMIYRVPITDVYRWEDINQAISQVDTELTQEQKPNSNDANITNQENNLLTRRVPSKQDSKLNEESAATTSSDLTKPHKLIAGTHLTKGKVSAESVEGEGMFDNKLKSINKNDVLKSKDPLPEPYQPGNADDRDQIPGGSVSSLKKQFSMEDSSKNRTSNNSMWIKNKTSSYDESCNIKVYGYCFVSEGDVNTEQVRDFSLGDIVVASPTYHDKILGEIRLIGEIPSIRKQQIFVGIEFEKTLDKIPFEILHVYGEINSLCNTRCEGGKKVLIHFEHLISTSFYKNVIRVLKNPKQTKAHGKSSTRISDIEVDFNYEANRKDFVSNPIDVGTIAEKLKDMGIEGNANSCYIDSAIFALYAFTCDFDGGLLKSVKSTKYAKEKNVKVDAARNVLKYDIVTQLRSLSKVNWVSVFKLRKALSEILNEKSYLGNFMDAETFITSLFSDVLQMAEFFEIGDDAKDYILQLFPPVTDGKIVKSDRSSVQYLLEEYFNWADVKLRKLPQPGFLIKLPVSNGVPHFRFTYPNLKLDLSKLLQKNGKCETLMDLRAVICLKANHFTCFVRSKTRNEVGKRVWLYQDSMANENGESILSECPELETALEIVSPAFENSGSKGKLPEKAKTFVEFLLETAYICVYEPFLTHETHL